MAIIQNLEAFVQSYPAGLDSVTDLQLSQNENGRQIRFTIGGVTIPAGSVATISGTKPDGVVYSNTGTIEGADTVIFDEDVQMTAVFGTWYAKIRITNAGNTIASARVRFIIDKDPVDAGAIPSESQLNGLVAEAEEYAGAAEDAAERAAITYGSPLTAATASAMTDINRVYVYTGSESGYTYGNWYYYNGSAWVSGGVYNSAAVETDTTLTESGVPADAKATGDKIDELKDDLTQLRLDVFESGTPGEYPHKTVSEFFSDTYPSGTSYPPSNGYIDINDIENLNSWYVTTTEAMDIFFDSSLDIGTFIVAKISNVTNTERTATHLRFYGSDPERYRYADGEGFPTESDKLHLNANDTVIISLQLAVSPNNVFIYYGARQQGDTVLNEDIMLNETQINQVIESLPSPGEFPYSAKRALLDCLGYLGWATDEGRYYYDALVEALNVDGHLDSITATFNQNGAAIYSTDSLDSLKPFLTVTANYADGSTAPVSDYTLTGTLTVGNCTITVGYEGKTTTFVVKCIAYFDHLTIDGVSYDISLSGSAPYKAVLKFSNDLLYLYYSSTPFYVRGAFPDETSQDNKYYVNIYGNACRGVQSGTSFESQGLLGMRGVNDYPGTNFNESNIGEVGREATPRTLTMIKWSLNDICLYDNGYTDTVLYPAD